MLKIVGPQRLSRNREEFGRLGSVFLQRPSHYGGQREAEQTPVPGKIQGWTQMFGRCFRDGNCFSETIFELTTC